MTRRRFGYKEDGSVDELAISALDQAVEMVVNGEMSLRQAAEWVEADCGKTITHAGIRKRLYPLLHPLFLILLKPNRIYVFHRLPCHQYLFEKTVCCSNGILQELL